MKKLAAAVIALCGVALAQTPTKPRSKVYREGNFQINQLVTPDFDELPLPRKLFAYHLMNAIEAGRDLVWIQKSRDGLEIRELFEDLWNYNSEFTPKERVAILQYMFRLYKSQGNYNEGANEKFVPENLTSQEFRELIGRIGDLNIEKRSANLNAAIFDLNYRRALLAPVSSPNRIGESAVNLYEPGFADTDYVSLSEADRQNLLTFPTTLFNSLGQRIVRRNMIGDRFDRQLRLVDHHFEKAKEVADAAEKEIISAYQKALHTGDSADLLAADTLWVQHKPQDLDFAIGFVETYMDPKGVRGTWEGTVLMFRTDKTTVARGEAIRSNVAYFESAMPVNPEFKKKGDFTPPRSESAYLVYVGGDSGGKPYLGKNLPNNNNIRELHGSKSWNSYNVMNEIGGDGGYNPKSLRAFYLPKYQEAMLRLQKVVSFDDIQVEFHEILGHGSGRIRDGVTGARLEERGYNSALEEARAEVASLYHFLDPKIMEFGIVPQMSPAEFGMLGEVVLVDFFSGQIRGYFQQPEETKEDGIRQAHRWARQTMLNRLISDGAIQVVIHEDAPKVEVLDLMKARASLGRLWDEIQTIKSTDDVERAERLLVREGKFKREHREWRRLVVNKVRQLNSPTESIYLNPKPVLIYDKEGKLVNVKLRYWDGSEGLNTLVERETELKREVNQNLLRVCGPVVKGS